MLASTLSTCVGTWISRPTCQVIGQHAFHLCRPICPTPATRHLGRPIYDPARGLSTSHALKASSPYSRARGAARAMKPTKCHRRCRLRHVSGDRGRTSSVSVHWACRHHSIRIDRGIDTGGVCTSNQRSAIGCADSGRPLARKLFDLEIFSQWTERGEDHEFARTNRAGNLHRQAMIRRDEMRSAETNQWFLRVQD